MISGKTRLIAHIGYPTESFKAPMIYNLGLLILKERKIFGIQSALDPDLEEVLAFMHEHRIAPPIWKTCRLEQAADAHRALGDREVVGRILLVP
jgi:D-arabinose 1-dehydrogenase-like Zn-dependent alcohol dehydrogenase